MQAPTMAPTCVAKRVARASVDWSCTSCGYDLSGSCLNDQCPECGRLVWSSDHRVGDVGEGPASGGTSRMLGALAVMTSCTMVGGFFLGVCAIRIGRRAQRDASRFGGHSSGAGLGVRLGQASIALSVAWFVGIGGVVLFA